MAHNEGCAWCEAKLAVCTAMLENEKRKLDARERLVVNRDTAVTLRERQAEPIAARAQEEMRKVMAGRRVIRDAIKRLSEYVRGSDAYAKSGKTAKARAAYDEFLREIERARC